jgi:hypothetical protein
MWLKHNEALPAEAGSVFFIRTLFPPINYDRVWPEGSKMKDYSIYLWCTVFLSSIISWSLFHLIGSGVFVIPVIALLIFISYQLNRLEGKWEQE